MDIDERKSMISHLKKVLQILENDNIPNEEVDEILPYSPDTVYDFRILSQLRKLNLKIDSLRNLRYFNCAIERVENPQTLDYLITSFATYKEAVKNLDSWLVGTTSLIVSDPYFFSFNKSKIHRTENEYTDSIISILPNKLKEIEIFHLPCHNKKIYERLRKHFNKKGIRFSNHSTTEIHDRVWIKDKSVGKVVGTSFGGIGNKIAFILDLPESDKDGFLKELHRIRHSS